MQTLLAGVLVAARAETRWTLAMTSAPGTPASEILEAFARSVAAQTAGALVLTPQPHRSQAPKTVKTGIRNGTPAIGEVRLADHADQAAIYAADLIPGLADTASDGRRLEQAARPLLARRLAEEGLVLLLNIPVAWEMLILPAQAPPRTPPAALIVPASPPPDTALVRFAELAGLHPQPLGTEPLSAALRTERHARAIVPAHQARPLPPGFTAVPFRLRWTSLVVNRAALTRLPEQARRAIVDTAEATQSSIWGDSDGTTAVAKLWEQAKLLQPSSPGQHADLRSAIARLRSEWRSGAGADGALLSQLGR